MHHRVYIHPNVEKRFGVLKFHKKGTARVAEKAERIVRMLCKGILPARAGRLSKNGDARLKGALKYDLGKGYRLVCLVRDQKLMVLFLGDHDACEIFMENLKNGKPWQNVRSMKIRVAEEGDRKKEKCLPEDPLTPACEKEPDFDDMLMEKVSQEDLRIIFKGLVCKD